nr:sushi, von Willebrand factor type A, EGF and pentraxin domain-containing protein 1-like isoform X2 [Misgurnus anguillicaudatus]
MVTVSSARPSAPQYVFGLSECGSGSDGFLTVGCIAKGFSPADSLTFKWTDHKGQPVKDFVQYPTIGREGGYTKISHLRVKKSDYTPDKPYKCEAGNSVAKKQAIVAPIVQCSELTKPNNGAMHCHHDSKGHFSYQSTCEFSCDKGYTLRNSSSSKLLCEATGHWNDSQPSCEIVKCNPDDVLTLHHGSVQCSGPNGNFSYDSVCEYSCDEGYEMKGSNTTNCTATTEWTSKPPTCELVQCSELTTPNNGTMQCRPNHDSKSNFSYQSTCEFSCDKGYTLRNSSSSTLLCGATGHWNDSQPSCEIVKCNPDDVLTLHHGSVQCSNPNGNFSYDSVCEYSCDEGYELKGSNTTNCTATTEWTSKPPTCELVQCSDLTKPNNGIMNCHHDSKGNFSYQSTCEFSCDEGYTLQTSSSSTLLCEATGHWNDSQPSCEIVKCNPDDVLTLHHGSVQCSQPNGMFAYDSVCEYSCEEEGYELKGSNTRKCTATTEWTSKPPTCEFVQCSELTTPNNGAMKCYDCNGKFSYKSTCEFACEEGYTLQTSSSSTLLCGATGHWNDSQPSCEIVKCNPGDVLTLHHGSVKCSHRNGNFSFDSVCEYSCEEGYELKGFNTSKCTATTEWTSKPPTCELVQCSNLTTPNHGTMHCRPKHDSKSNFSYQSTCEFACKEGYTLPTSSSSTLLCGATGHWNDSQPSCEIVKCNPVEVLNLHHGSVQCSQPNGMFAYDSVCEYSCDEGYELKGSDMTNCTATTEWTSKPPTCELVQCSELTKPNNGVMQCYDFKGKFSYKSTCEFACEEGYTLRTSSSSTLLCEATGHWNDTQPSCEIVKCNSEDVTTLHHGMVQCSNPNGNFSYDSVCEYSCEEGYELKGCSSTNCTATTKWTSKPPTCELVQCSNLTTPNHGTMHCRPKHDSKSNFSYQSTCEFACKEGYTLPTSSSSTLLCGATGHWNDSQPSCEIVKCNPVEVLTLHHGSVQCSQPNGMFAYDSVCEYSCEEGYELKGSDMTNCTATTEWTSKPPTCELVQCSELTKPNNGVMQCYDFKGKFSYKSTCEFACEEGYTLRTSSSSTLLCEATGHWNDSQPSCEIVKCNPEDVTTLHHGRVQCSEPNGNFSYDSICEYSCEEGYELKGCSSTNCTATTKWTSKPPTCELVQCPELTKPNNGIMQCHHDSKSNFSYQSTCEFACEEGYTLRTSSSSTLLCGATGLWNDSQPSCEIVKCNPVEVLTLLHGMVQCSKPNGMFAYDSVCEYSCEEGYELKGSNTRKCTATTKWTSKPPTCELVQCSELITPNNGVMQCYDFKGKFSYKSTCEFACEEGYTLRTSSSSTLLCGATGVWNDSQPSCEIIKCKPGDITTPDHGSVQCSNPNGNFSYNSVCEYSCAEGYELKGSNTRKCTATTKWTGKPPTCELVQCSELTKPNNGTMQCHHDSKSNFSYQSTCEFACKKGYTLRTSSSSTLLCEATGHWNDSQPSCEIVKCNPMEVLTLHHGSVQCSQPNGMFAYDSVCEYSCDEGYELKGSDTRNCTATTKWTSKPPTCELVQCSELITPHNGVMQCYDFKGKFSYKSTCEFACEEGYTLRTSSSSTLLCGATGVWNDSQPSCEIIKCKPGYITTPVHGSVQCSEPNGKFSYDSVCEYSCEEGYELKGTYTTNCTATTEWTSKPPTCEPPEPDQRASVYLTTPTNEELMSLQNLKQALHYTVMKLVWRKMSSEVSGLLLPHSSSSSSFL